jgi:hypothetical protein
MRYVIHIGTAKTATTSIQAFLTVNHERLLRSGIYYPIIRGKNSHNFLLGEVIFNEKSELEQVKKFSQIFIKRLRKKALIPF